MWKQWLDESYTTVQIIGKLQRLKQGVLGLYSCVETVSQHNAKWKQGLHENYTERYGELDNRRVNSCIHEAAVA